jgi:rhodanese-related sulfurtransferase
MRILAQKRRTDRDGVPMISIEDLRRRLDRGEPVVPLDVRQPAAYATYPDAIPRSLRIPPFQLPERYDEIQRDRLIVPYCT